MDEAELVEFCERTVDDVYRYARRLTGGDEARTADLVQDTYVSLMRHLREGSAVVVGLPWLITACRHRFIDEMRRSGRRERPRPKMWTSPPSSQDPHTGVAETLIQMPPIQRAALVMSHMDQMSVAEIAAALGRSIHATESILRRGRATFRRIYLSDEAQEANRGA